MRSDVHDNEAARRRHRARGRPDHPHCRAALRLRGLLTAQPQLLEPVFLWERLFGTRGTLDAISFDVHFKISEAREVPSLQYKHQSFNRDVSINLLPTSKQHTYEEDLIFSLNTAFQKALDVVTSEEANDKKVFSLFPIVLCNRTHHEIDCQIYFLEDMPKSIIIIQCTFLWDKFCGDVSVYGKENQILWSSLFVIFRFPVKHVALDFNPRDFSTTENKTILKSMGWLILFLHTERHSLLNSIFHESASWYQLPSHFAEMSYQMATALYISLPSETSYISEHSSGIKERENLTQMESANAFILLNHIDSSSLALLLFMVSVMVIIYLNTLVFCFLVSVILNSFSNFGNSALKHRNFLQKQSLERIYSYNLSIRQTLAKNQSEFLWRTLKGMIFHAQEYCIFRANTLCTNAASRNIEEIHMKIIEGNETKLVPLRQVKNYCRTCVEMMVLNMILCLGNIDKDRTCQRPFVISIIMGLYAWRAGLISLDDDDVDGDDDDDDDDDTDEV
eukprot:bmy_16525T0